MEATLATSDALPQEVGGESEVNRVHQDMHIFLSAVSGQFKACRDALASDLRAIGCEVRVQEDFQQGPRSLIERLEEYVAQCDRVIAVVGDAYGAEAGGDAVPASDLPRSYTQWEYFFAQGERLNGTQAAPKDLNVYFASPRFLEQHPVTEDAIARERQERFARRIEASGKHWSRFDTLDHLCRQVLKDAFQIGERPEPVDEAILTALARAREAITTGDPIDDAVNDTIRRHRPRTLEEYRVWCWAEWSQPRYALDKRFTRLTVLLDQGADAQGPRWQPHSRPFEDLRDVLADLDTSAMVVLGPPGCGKSTLLRRLELDLAVDALGAGPSKAPLSVFLPLNRYRPARLGEPLPSPHEWLRREWAQRFPAMPPLDTLLQSESLVFLLDAVNEMPHAGEDDYRQRIALWRDCLADLARTAPGTRAVFSCRSLDYSAPLSTPDLPVPQVRIEPMGDEQIQQFLAVYSPEHVATVWRHLDGTSRLELFRSPFYLKLLLAQSELDDTFLTGRAALFTGFVRQALRREIDADNPLFKPGTLFEKRDYDRAVRHEWRDTYDLPTRGPLFPALSSLALGLQRRRGVGEVAQVRASYDEALALLGQNHGEELLHAGVDLQLLELQWDDVFFVHQLLQEYFAAREVVQAPEPQLAFAPWRLTEMSPSLEEELRRIGDADPLPAAPTTGWEETFLLAAPMMPKADAFIDAVSAVNLPLAGRCAAEPEVAIAAELRARLQHALVARSRDPAADLRARIAAARALGELGDPRYERRRGPDGDFLLPPMIAVPGDTYPIGSDERLYEDEAPAHSVRVSTFAMGQFPVTTAEWRLFMESGGYDDERWWDTEAARAWRRGEGTAEGPKQEWRQFRQHLQANPAWVDEQLAAARATSAQVEFWRELREEADDEFEARLDRGFPAGRQTQPGFWEDPAFNHASQPVVGVCWHEARAYCAWLSAQSGVHFRLPTEVEWEAAARGRAARRYPWPGEFDAAQCNVFETHVRNTTPPGVFPGGDSPEGLADLSGNVWEWTSSLYRPYPYDMQDGREDPEIGDVPRAVRGGSWGRDRSFARCAFRGNFHPGSRYDDVGFRVVCVSPIA